MRSKPMSQAPSRHTGAPGRPQETDKEHKYSHFVMRHGFTPFFSNPASLDKPTWTRPYGDSSERRQREGRAEEAK
jgi:hypothetical protein